MNYPFDNTNIYLETERLILRPFEQSDLDDLFEYASVPGVGEMAGWSHHENKEVSQRILDMFINEKHVFAIYHKEDKKVIGSVGVEPYKFENELFEVAQYKGRELGFALSKKYWGQGIMVEACKEVIRYLFKYIDLDFLMCGFFDYNKQSISVQTKLGFKQYRKVIYKTYFGTIEPGTFNILINPKKNIKIDYSLCEKLLENY